MKKAILKFINCALDFTPFVPIGWVLTCYELGLNWISVKPVDGIYTLIASTLISSALWAFGTFAAHGGWDRMPESDYSDMSLWERVRNLFILLLIHKKEPI